MCRKAKLMFLFILAFQFGKAQEIKIESGFVQDSIKIGLEVDYWVTAKYPPAIDLLFPDSAKLEVFEFAGIEYFPSELRDSLAFDSAVYKVVTFEIDPIQALSVPVRVINQADTIILNSPMDSINLIELVEVATDTTALIENTDYTEVNREFNTPLLIYISGGFLLLVIIALIIFGKRILRYFKLRRMDKRHLQFTEELEAYILKLKEQAESKTAELALNLWKVYMEKIEAVPYSRLTSKEIIKLAQAGELKEALGTIDRCVYGNKATNQLFQDFQHLASFANNRYQEQVDIIKHGKR